MREDRDERRNNIWINGCRVVPVRPVELGCALLDGWVVAEFALCANEFTPQLLRQLALAASRNPPQVCNGRTDPISYERFKGWSIFYCNDPIQEGEGIK